MPRLGASRGAGLPDRRARHILWYRGPDFQPAGEEQLSADRDQEARSGDQGNLDPAGRNCRPARAAAGGRRPAGRSQPAGAPAQRAGSAAARRRLSDEHEAGQPDGHAAGHGAVQRARVGTAAQPRQQQPVAGQAGTGRNHVRQRQPEPARPAARRELHDAHRPQAAHRCAESRRRRGQLRHAAAVKG